MNIISAQYYKNQYNNNDGIKVILEDGNYISVPLDPDNRHYAEILKQVKEEGLTIKDAD